MIAWIRRQFGLSCCAHRDERTRQFEQAVADVERNSSKLIEALEKADSPYALVHDLRNGAMVRPRFQKDVAL